MFHIRSTIDFWHEIKTHDGCNLDDSLETGSGKFSLLASQLPALAASILHAVFFACVIGYSLVAGLGTMEMSVAKDHESLEAPLLQHMTTDLESLSGLVIRQQAQWGEVLAQAALLPYEAFNKYKVSELPANRSVARDLPATWRPTGAELDALPELMRVEESSSPWLRSLLTCIGKATRP
jgi:hypothetical protein